MGERRGVIVARETSQAFHLEMEGWRISEGLHYFRGLKVSQDSQWSVWLNKYVPKEDGSRRPEATYKTAVECVEGTVFDTLFAAGWGSAYA